MDVPSKQYGLNIFYFDLEFQGLVKVTLTQDQLRKNKKVQYE